MKISLNWIKQFVEIPKEITPEKLAELLTLKTVEVEGIEKQGETLDGVVVGKILEVSKHSDADKLHVCKVDIGEGEAKQIICGGTNLIEGMLVAVAKIGAKVKWHGEGEFVEVKKVKIRGIESEGMICASSEIGLSDLVECKEGEIINISSICHPEERMSSPIGERMSDEGSRTSQQSAVGASLSKALGLDDTIFEIDNKSLTNRPDLWSHMGIAREIAAITSSKFQVPSSKFSLKEFDSCKLNEKLSVTVESSEFCKRYMVVSMSNIKIGHSPEWMQKRLLAAGMRPINNIVDVTNFVMLETGQPMHAFDQLRITNYELRIRNAKKSETIKTLDGIERKLDESMLVIADAEKAIAVAGIMGGENSEVDDSTTDIVIESANFEKVNNRKTSSKLGLRTEASMRYEKGLDPNLAEQALARCVELIKQIIPESEISSDIIDVGAGLDSLSDSKRAPARPIEIGFDYINKKIGADIPQEKVISILESLGFSVGAENFQPLQILQIAVPTWRATGDISIPEDIIEEIARIYGYDNIQPQVPNLSIAPPEENKERKLIRKIKNILSAGFGMAETSNYSFIGKRQIEDLGIPSFGRLCPSEVNEGGRGQGEVLLGECIQLANPLSADLEFLRPNLAINLLKNAKDNLRFFEQFKMFEVGSIFKNAEGSDCADPKCTEKLPWQEKFVGGIVVSGKNSIPFYEAKNIVEELCQELNIDVEITEDNKPDAWQHPYRCANVGVRGFTRLAESKRAPALVDIGYITELNPVIAKSIGIKNARVAVFEVSIKALLELSLVQKSYKEISKFPAVLRDLAIVVKKEILSYNIIEAIREAGGDALKNIELFDFYEGDKIPADSKSLAFHLVFQSNERTLEDGEIEGVIDKIIGDLKEMGAKLR